MRALHMLAALVALSFNTVLYAQDAPAGERHHVGLIIGNSRYVGGENFKPLPNACSDAQNVAASLVRIGWKEDTEIDLQCDLTVDQMSTHVRRFVAQLIDDPYAVGVFYFAGHGVQVDARQFIFGVDAKPNLDVARRQIERNPDSQLFLGAALDVYADFIQDVGAVTDGGLTVIIDACRSDPLIKSLKGNGLRSITAPTVRTTLLPGIMIAASTQNGEVALDGGGAIGPYAAALQSSIARDKFVASIMGEVTTKVWTSTRQMFPQHPQIPYFSGVPSFPCLAGCATPTGAPPQPPPDHGPGFAATTGKASVVLAALATLSPRDGVTNSRLASLFHRAQAATTAPPARIPVFNKLITPLFVQQALQNRRQVKGLRVDIFWCEAGDDVEGRKAAAERYGEYLKARATERGEGQEIASVRLRVLTRNGNALPSYRFVQNAVVNDLDNPIADKWAGIMADTKDLIRVPASNNGDYMGMFVCSIGAQTPFPASVYWHVPTASHVSLANGLINKLDEQTGNFKAIPDVEVVETGPQVSQVRYYYDADQTVAYRLADSIQVLLGHEVLVKYFTSADVATSPKPGTVEVWIGKDETAEPVLGRVIASVAPSRNQTIKQ
jgi:hypothetical protein